MPEKENPKEEKENGKVTERNLYAGDPGSGENAENAILKGKVKVKADEEFVESDPCKVRTAKKLPQDLLNGTRSTIG